MLKREFKFSILTRAGDILPDGGDEEILLQGVIDLCTEDEKGLTIIDFKTDKVNEITQYKRAEYYKGQMLAYGLAMEKITGKPVCRRLIYFFNTGETIDV
jgi:ATP-dependent helicase/nuclease subunit A